MEPKYSRGGLVTPLRIDEHVTRQRQSEHSILSVKVTGSNQTNERQAWDLSGNLSA